MIRTEDTAAAYAASLRDSSPEAVTRSLALAQDPELARDARPRSDREATTHVLEQCSRAKAIDEASLARRQRQLERRLEQARSAVEKAQAEADAAAAELDRVSNDAGQRRRLVESAILAANNNRHARAACRHELVELDAWQPGWGEA